jgi:hypothetical protein
VLRGTVFFYAAQGSRDMLTSDGSLFVARTGTPIRRNSPYMSLDLLKSYVADLNKAMLGDSGWMSEIPVLLPTTEFTSVTETRRGIKHRIAGYRWIVNNSKLSID